MEKSYEPKQFEKKWSDFWEEKRHFHPGVDSKKTPYTIIIPPPNVTSQLHMGHALNNTIQDIMMRWQKMRGKNGLWIPGTDHAGIATQNMVEKNLDEQKIDRKNLSREELIQKIWEWKDLYGSRIIEQLKKMGCGCDWERERFTMDEGLGQAVLEAFRKLYRDGLIYRGKYIVNWCMRCKTALSDEEVDHKPIDGYLYILSYPCEDGSGSLEVATTRPETIFGDTAVMVNPWDKRYREMVGKKVILPLVGRKLLVIADEKVKMDFGTGAVKVTPSHDPNDFEVGKKHGLEFINVMNEDGTMNDGAGIYAGLDRLVCRDRVLKDLEFEGNLKEKRVYNHDIGHCYRCNRSIEPRLSNQWFVKMEPLSRRAIEVVEEGRIRFYPGRWKKVYIHWLSSIQDWCISRQIVWGHRIPIWYCLDCGGEGLEFDRCKKCQSSRLKQDEDVLDTWFSSMLWPFSTLGWPLKNEELDYFYPGAMVSTAPEILFFWIARMVMAGLYFVGDVPFREVYLHSTVRDKLGRKMSKSLGNGIDPVDVIEEHGADALRFTLIYLAPMGLDMKLAYGGKENDFLLGSRFANKLWNASRYLLMRLRESGKGGGFGVREDWRGTFLDLPVSEKWIMTRLQKTIREVEGALETYRLFDMARQLYHFVWHDFCDWYIEITKKKGKDFFESGFLEEVLRNILRLLHPVMPLITAEIYEKLSGGKNILEEEYPKYEGKLVEEESIQKMGLMQESVLLIRRIRASGKVGRSVMKVYFSSQSEEMDEVLKDEDSKRLILDLGGARELGSKPAGYGSSSFRLQGRGYEIDADLGGMDIGKDKADLVQRYERLELDLKRSRAKLENENFLTRAKPEAIEKERVKNREFSFKVEKLKRDLNELERLMGEGSKQTKSK